MYPWRTVGLAAALVNLADPPGEDSVFPAPPRRRSILPVVVAASGDLKHPTQHRDGKARPLRVDELKKLHRLPSSLAKKAALGSTVERNSLGQCSSRGSVA